MQVARQRVSNCDVTIVCGDLVLLIKFYTAKSDRKFQKKPPYSTETSSNDTFLMSDDDKQ